MEMLIKINGIHCGGCLTRIEKRLTELEVTAYDLDLKTKIAKIVYEPSSSLTSQIIKENIHSLGYEPDILIEIK